LRGCASCAAGDKIAQSSGAYPGDPAHYVAVAEYERALTELNALKADRVRDRAAQAVEDTIRAGKISPAQRDWAIAYCAADARGFQAFAARQPSIIGGNMGLAEPPPAERQVRALSVAELAICSQLGLKHSEFIRRKRGRPDFLSLDRTGADLLNAEVRDADFRNNQD